MNFSKVLVVLDGDIASAVLLAHVIKEKNDGTAVMAVYPNFNLPHDKQRCDCASRLADWYDVPLQNINLAGIVETVGFDYFEPTVEWTFKTKRILREPRVPFRNGIIISAAVAYAYAHGFGTVYMPSTRSDGVYDSVSNFDVPMANAVIAGTNSETVVLMPFERDELEFVVERGIKIGVPPYLTQSCYDTTLGNEYTHCGQCWGCLQRYAAFKAVMGHDGTTEYREEPSDEQIEHMNSLKGKTL